MFIQGERHCAIQVSRQFNGPPSSAHGGYLCGRLAALLPASEAAVTLLSPPPLEADLQARRDGHRVTLWHQDRLLATAVAAGHRPPEVEPEPLGWSPADRSSGSFAGFERHPFPSCFVCGTERPDGMRLFPAPVAHRPGTVAAAWTPAPELAGDGGLVRPEFVWAALDCPGGWSAMPAGQHDTLVLARMSLRLGEAPRCGQRYVVLGRLDRRAGRTAWVRTGLFDSAGTALATGTAQWLSVDPGHFQVSG